MPLRCFSHLSGCGDVCLYEGMLLIMAYGNYVKPNLNVSLPDHPGTDFLEAH